MPQHDGQLRLTPETQVPDAVVVGLDGQEREPTAPAGLLIDLVLPDRVVKLLRRLTPGGALRFSQRAPVVLQELLEEIIAVGQLPDRELDARLRRHRVDAERLEDEQRRRMAARDPHRPSDDTEEARGLDGAGRPSRPWTPPEEPPGPEEL